MNLVTMGGDIFEEISERGSEGQEGVKSRQQVTGDRFGRARWWQSER
jgi:hypothetical protein